MSAKLIATLTTCTLAGLAFAGPALASPHGHHSRHQGHHARPDQAGTIVVDNRYVDRVNVTIDGSTVGSVRSGDDGVFRVRPGRHDVTVQTLDGYVLSSGSEWTRPREIDRVAIYNPMVPLTVRNTGTQTLWVSGAQGGQWVARGRTVTIDVPAGKWELNAAVQRHGRLIDVDCKAVYARPGRHNRVVFDYAPAATRLVLSNLEPRPVSVTLDGRSYGTLASGRSFTIDVRPGAHTVAAFSRHGAVVFRGRVTAGRASDTRIELYRPRPVPGTQSPHDRPGRGPRTAHH